MDIKRIVSNGFPGRHSDECHAAYARRCAAHRSFTAAVRAAKFANDEHARLSADCPKCRDMRLAQAALAAPPDEDKRAVEARRDEELNP